MVLAPASTTGTGSSTKELVLSRVNVVFFLANETIMLVLDLPNETIFFCPTEKVRVKCVSFVGTRNRGVVQKEWKKTNSRVNRTRSPAWPLTGPVGALPRNPMVQCGSLYCVAPTCHILGVLKTTENHSYPRFFLPSSVHPRTPNLIIISDHHSKKGIGGTCHL